MRLIVKAVTLMKGCLLAKLTQKEKAIIKAVRKNDFSIFDELACNINYPCVKEYNLLQAYCRYSKQVSFGKGSFGLRLIELGAKIDTASFSAKEDPLFLLLNKLSFELYDKKPGDYDCIVDSLFYLISSCATEHLMRRNHKDESVISVLLSNALPSIGNHSFSERLSRLIDAGFDINLTDSKNENILFYVTPYSVSTDEIKHILKLMDVNLNQVNTTGQTAGHKVIRSSMSYGLDKSVDIVSSLIEKGLNPDLRDNKGARLKDLVTNRQTIGSIDVESCLNKIRNAQDYFALSQRRHQVSPAQDHGAQMM